MVEELKILANFSVLDFFSHDFFGEP